jgi:hypothetical protein
VDRNETDLIDPLTPTSFPTECTLGYNDLVNTLAVVIRLPSDPYSWGNDFGDNRIDIYVASIWIGVVASLLTGLFLITFVLWGLLNFIDALRSRHGSIRLQ